MVRWRKLYFEKVKYTVESDPTKIKSICDSYIQEMVIKYCLEQDTMFKNLKIDSTGKCSVKLLCNKNELSNLSMNLIINECKYIKNIVY